MQRGQKHNMLHWKRHQKQRNNNRNRNWQKLLIFLQWRHNEHHGVWNHRKLHCLFCSGVHQGKYQSSASLPCVRGLPSQRASNAENVSMSKGHHHGPTMERLFWVSRVIRQPWDIGVRWLSSNVLTLKRMQPRFRDISSVALSDLNVSYIFVLYLFFFFTNALPANYWYLCNRYGIL